MTPSDSASAASSPSSPPSPDDVVRVLSHVGNATALGLPDDLADRVEITTVPMHGEVDADVVGDVLVTVPGWAENTAALLDRGVKWVHYVSTGVDSVRFDELPAGLIVTNSRGASAVPISEWVMA